MSYIYMKFSITHGECYIIIRNWARFRGVGGEGGEGGKTKNIMEVKLALRQRAKTKRYQAYNGSFLAT